MSLWLFHIIADVNYTDAARGVDLQLFHRSAPRQLGGTNPPALFNLTQGGPSVEPSNVGKIESSVKETTSEESATYGGL